MFTEQVKLYGVLGTRWHTPFLPTFKMKLFSC